MTAVAFEVQVVPRGITFGVARGETVLQAADRQGVSLKYGCRHGNCSTCKYLLVEGEVDHGPASPYSLSESEREEGWALLCCAVPLEDLVIEDTAPLDGRAYPVITPSVRLAMVEEVEPLGGEMIRLVLAADADPLPFYPGQFVELALPDHDTWRCYSLACAPSEARRPSFVVEQLPGGAFSGQVATFERGQPLAVRGPFGDAYLRPGDDPVLLVAGGGSAIAPILSILRHAAETGDRRELRLFYGTRTPQSLVCLEEIESYERQLSLETTLCVSDPGYGDSPASFVGGVTQAIQHLVADASVFDAYVCGKAEMCERVGRLLEAKGLRDGRCFADPFFSAISGVAVGQP
jgi:NAD(P)H-flavin reductase/ferredoxin